MKKNSFTPILVLAIIIVLAGVGYFGYKNLYTRPSTTQATIDTTNWKTYTNNEFKYQLRYPQALFLLEEGAGTSIVIKAFSNVNAPGLFRVDLMINANPTKQIIKKWYENFLNQIYGENRTPVNGETIEEITISGESAVRLTQPVPSLKRTDVAIFIPSGPDVLEVSYSLTSDSNFSESVFDQILSTFKFIN